MAHPDLYRSGNTTSPRFDNVRIRDERGDVDIDENGEVVLNGKGISCFRSKIKSWRDNATWVLKKSTPLVPGLTAHQNVGDSSDEGSDAQHRLPKRWFIAPAWPMSLDTYKGLLRTLNGKAVRYPQRGTPSESPDDDFPPDDDSPDDNFPPYDESPDDEKAPVHKALESVEPFTCKTSSTHNAPRTVGRRSLDEALGHDLDDGLLHLSTLVCHPASRWTPELAFASEHREEFKSENVTVDPGPDGTTVLATQSRYHNTDFVCYVFASVIRGSLSIAGWDESDYKHLAVLARGLQDRSLPLKALIWDPASGWTRDKALAAQAVCAFMADEWTQAMASNDEDVEADAANDHAYLRSLFGLMDRENPFSAFDDPEAVM